MSDSETTLQKSGLKNKNFNLSKKLSKKFKPWFFLAPALIIYLLVIVIPTFYTVYLSLVEWNGVSAVKTFIGLQNYIDLFINDNVFLKSFNNTIIWTILSLVASMFVALLLALFLNRNFKGKTFFRAAFYFPFILSNIVVAIIWVWIYNPSMGLINEILGWFGLEGVAWLSEPQIALYAVFIASTWQFVGNPMIIFLAGLQAMPEEPFEAAKVDGASIIQGFFKVTVPLLRETFIIVFATTLFNAMRVFDIIYAMTGGGPAQNTQVLASWMYYQSFTVNNIGPGSAISIILLIIVLIVGVPYILWQGRQSHNA